MKANANFHYQKIAAFTSSLEHKDNEKENIQFLKILSCFWQMCAHYL